ncbi:hypothetical protein OG453_18645 [Streptomyces sp. NBC_01381]|uniref:hypothetical protein n=1 Tax=Streptomyces sp. NBC_01381 TaxID=2903845 RepID=UPI002252134D|nr:hypothetical protein [Streptomyces sp. NBC_01381]MCX4668670.1 hypothetical protein [Streptomyces sp. NBC_01381]
MAWWARDGRPVRTDPADTWERAGLPDGVRLEFSAGGARVREFTRDAAWWSPDGRVRRADPTDRDRLPGGPCGRGAHRQCAVREFTRGAAWWSPHGCALRADPADRERLPGDTGERAGLPAEVPTGGAQ